MQRLSKAIVVAAGMGRRLRPFTDEMPKCLVPVRGRPMLVRQLDAYRRAGLTEFVIVRGYKADVLERRREELGPGVRFVDNADYESNNVLLSLFCAEAELDGPFVMSYGDIVFAPDVVDDLLAAPGDIALVVDRGFRRVYQGRTEHPLDEAEVCSVDAAGRVTKVGKRSLPASEAWGEFIGLMRVSAEGARAFTAAWREVAAQFRGREDEPFQRAPSFRQAYLTDLLQYLIDAGADVRPAPIDGRWREIDTTQDLDRAGEAVDW